MINIYDYKNTLLLHLLNEDETEVSVSDKIQCIPLNEGSVYHTELMSSDYIRLRFSLETPIELSMGCYIKESSLGSVCKNNPLGWFILDKEATPTYNQSNGGYDYDIEFVAWYYFWNRYVLKLNPKYGAQESNFTQTTTIDGHLAVFKENIDRYFAESGLNKYNGYEIRFNIQSTVTGEAKPITFDSVRVTDALTTIAETFECEWWIDNNVINFGKCQKDNTTTLSIGDELASLSRSDSSGEYATRVYGFGSTRNISARYRKTLILDVKEKGVSSGGYDEKGNSVNYQREWVLDTARVITPKLFDSSRKVIVEKTERKSFSSFDVNVNSASISFNTYSNVLGTHFFELGHAKEGILRVSTDITCLVRNARSAKVTVNVVGYKNDMIDGTPIFNGVLGAFNSTEAGDKDCLVTITKEDSLKEFNVTEDCYLFVTFDAEFVGFSTNTVMQFVYNTFDRNDIGYVISTSLNVLSSDNSVTEVIPVVVNATALGGNSDDTAKIYLPQGYSLPIGARFTLDYVIKGKVDVGCFTNDNPTDANISSFEKRLMLPLDKCPNNFVDSESIKDKDGKVIESKIVEAIVVFDDVYPKKEAKIAKVDTYPETVTDPTDEQGGTKEVTRYRIFVDKSEFYMKNEYLLSDSTLSVVFQSGKLAGMTFELENFVENISGSNSQSYDLVITDYGVDLPNAALYPSADDVVVFVNYDTALLSDGDNTLVSSAEEELYNRVVEYLKESSLDNSTYSAVLMSDYAYGLDDKGSQDSQYAKVFTLGDSVHLEHEGFFGDKGRTSRVIGLDIKLDVPYDAPSYTIGESKAYSRLNDLEGKIEGIKSTQVFSFGGSSSSKGSGVDIKTSTSTAQSTETNVYSAAASDKHFLNKNKNEVVNGKITFNKGLTSNGDVDINGKTTSKGAVVGKSFTTTNFVTGEGGDGARIDEHGNGEMQNLRVWQSLTVSELRFDRASVLLGTNIQTYTGGVIGKVTPYDNYSGEIELEMNDNEFVGSVQDGALCVGYYHDVNGGNATLDSDDFEGTIAYKGTKCCQFAIDGILDAKSTRFRYELREGTSVHPVVGMTFKGTGNFKDATLGYFTIATPKYTAKYAFVESWRWNALQCCTEVGGSDISGFAALANEQGNWESPKPGTIITNLYTRGTFHNVTNDHRYIYITQSSNGMLTVGETEKVSIVIRDNAFNDRTKEFSFKVNGEVVPVVDNKAVFSIGFDDLTQEVNTYTVTATDGEFDLSEEFTERKLLVDYHLEVYKTAINPNGEVEGAFEFNDGSALAFNNGENVANLTAGDTIFGVRMIGTNETTYGYLTYKIDDGLEYDASEKKEVTVEASNTKVTFTWYHDAEHTTPFAFKEIPVVGAKSAFMIFHDSAERPDVPLVGEDISLKGWHQGQSLKSIWMSSKTSVSILDGSWGEPVKIAGSDGTSVTIVGRVASASQLPAVADDKDGYIAEDTGDLWVYYSGQTPPWVNVGRIKGENGDNAYVHIKYSHDGKTFSENDGETPAEYMGTYADNTKADSNKFSDYTWKKIVGDVYHLFVNKAASDISGSDLGFEFNDGTVLAFNDGSSVEYIGIGDKIIACRYLNEKETTEGYLFYSFGEKGTKVSCSNNEEITVIEAENIVFWWYRDAKFEELISYQIIPIIQSGVSSFISLVFKRTNSKPSKPTTGSYIEPVPAIEGWSDGIPNGEEIVWMSQRVFFSDNTASSWSEPSQITDTQFDDFEFSSAETYTEIPNSVHGINTDKSAWGWSNEATEDTIWMARSHQDNGVWSEWTYTKIKGERGIEGKSAYDVAKDNGFVGSETEWLESLRGASIEEVVEFYAINDDEKVYPVIGSDAWKKTLVNPTKENPYLWNYEETHDSDGNVVATTTPVIIARWTKDGKGIKSIVEEYALSADKDADPTSLAWSTSVPKMDVENRYLWNRETVNYTEGEATHTDPAIIGVYGDTGTSAYQEWLNLGHKGTEADFIASLVGAQGLSAYEVYKKDAESKGETPLSESAWLESLDGEDGLSAYDLYKAQGGTMSQSEWLASLKGSDGTSVSGVEEQYAYGTSTAVTGSWGTAALAPTSTNQYVWNREKITYSDGKTSYTTAHLVNKYIKDGANGSGIASFSDTYAVTNTTAVPSSFPYTSLATAVAQMSDAKKYLWDKEVTKYTEGKADTSTIRLIAVYGDKGEPGASINAQYSADKTNWHGTFQTNDVWMRTKKDNDTDWSQPMRVVGEAGAAGADGKNGEYTDFSFALSTMVETASETTAPTIYGSWSDKPLAVTPAYPFLWMRKCKMVYNTTSKAYERSGNYYYSRITGENGKVYEIKVYEAAADMSGETQDGFQFNDGSTLAFNDGVVVAAVKEGADISAIRMVSNEESTIGTLTVQFDEGTKTTIANKTKVEIPKGTKKVTFEWKDANGKEITHTIIPVISDGVASFTSIIFKRSQTKPATPTKGTWVEPTPEVEGWSDGIPTGEFQLWMSKRVFYDDNTVTTWSEPSAITETETLDFAYNSSESEPSAPTEHGVQTSGGWHNDPTPSDIWMAIDRKINGVWQGWQITKFKGERGFSAYEVWKKEGHTGSEADFLESLIGERGASVGTIVEYYALNNSETTAPSSGWSTTISYPTKQNRYLWNKETIIDTDGSEITTTTPTVISRWTKDGRGIVSIDEYYQVSASKDVAPTTWVKGNAPKLTAELRYLWNYEVTTYKDGEPLTEQTNPAVIGVYGDKGDKGDKGDGNVIADLDNEMDSIITDANGNFSGTVNLYSNVVMYYGVTKLTITSATFSSVAGVSSSYANGKCTFAVTQAVADKAIVTITLKASHNGTEYSRDLTFTISKVKKGATGASAVVYALKLSNSAVSINKSGVYYPNRISASVVKTDGSTSTEISSLPSGMKIQYSYNSDAAHWNDGSSVSVDSTVSYLHFRIVYNGVELDRESVPFIHDGSDGSSTTITNTETAYAVHTSGTAAPSSGWVVGSVPTVEQGKYLWTRTTVTYSDGKSTVSYSVSYFGLDGDGTSAARTLYMVSDTRPATPSGLNPSGWSINPQALKNSIVSAVSATSLAGLKGGASNLYEWTKDANGYWTSVNKDDSSSSLLRFMVVADKSGYISLDYVVSSESGYDKGNIYDADGTTVAKSVSGSDSGSYQMYLTKGSHFIDATYSKDGSDYGGNDNFKVRIETKHTQWKVVELLNPTDLSHMGWTDPSIYEGEDPDDVETGSMEGIYLRNCGPWDSKTKYYNETNTIKPQKWADAVTYNGKKYLRLPKDSGYIPAKTEGGVTKVLNPEEDKAHWEEFALQMNSIYANYIMADVSNIRYMSGQTVSLANDDGAVTSGMSGGSGVQIFAGAEGVSESANPINPKFAVDENGVVTSQGSDNKIVMNNGLINVYGKFEFPNIIFGIDETGMAIMTYYDNDGNKLYDLGPNGIVMIESHDGKMMSTRLYKLDGAPSGSVIRNFFFGWDGVPDALKKFQAVQVLSSCATDSSYYYKYMSGTTLGIKHDADDDGKTYTSNSTTGSGSTLQPSSSNSVIADGWYINAPSNQAECQSWRFAIDTIVDEHYVTTPFCICYVYRYVGGRVAQTIKVAMW